MTDLEKQFKERTLHHIELVNKYAKKLGREFPDHDSSKLDLLLPGYKYFCKPRQELTKQEQEALDLVTLMHITSSPHHPEYWTSTPLSGFTRVNYCPNGPIDATEMPEECLEQMVCDWCAVSEEKGNTPMEWFELINNKRWIFTPEQQEFIVSCINKAWNENTNNEE